MKQKYITTGKAFTIIFLLISLPIAAIAEIQVYDANDQYLGVLLSDTEIFIPSVCKRAHIIYTGGDSYVLSPLDWALLYTRRN